MGIEPTQPAWKAGILAIELHPHISHNVSNKLYISLTLVYYNTVKPLCQDFFEIFSHSAGSRICSDHIRNFSIAISSFLLFSLYFTTLFDIIVYYTR